MTSAWETQTSTRRRAKLRADRVVVAIDAQVGLLGDPQHLSAVDVQASPAGAAVSVLAPRRPAPENRADRSMHAPVGSIAPAVELGLEVQRVRQPPARSKLRSRAPSAAQEALTAEISTLMRTLSLTSTLPLPSAWLNFIP